TIVSKEYKNPILKDAMSYGKLGWYILHFVLISTIFLAGFYLGQKL
ncbi:MAG: hypothetical protein K0Q65_2150, partial [Clostridia bacterium]|nr:hypothetical protein [Clostridia bacterium]